MKTYKIGDKEWYDLNEIVKECHICCGTSYLVKKNSIIELTVWAGNSNDKPLWFADEYSKEDEKYYQKERYALLKKNTIFCS